MVSGRKVTAQFHADAVFGVFEVCVCLSARGHTHILLAKTKEFDVILFR